MIRRPDACKNQDVSRVSVFAILLNVAAVAATDPVVGAWAAIDRGLHSGDFEHRRQALVALSTIPGTNLEAVRRVEGVLKNDKDARVRQEAALALGQMKATSAIPSLRTALDDDGEV